MNVKLCTVLATLCVLASAAFAVDIVTTKGTIYRDAEVKAVEREGLRIAHRDGVAFIPFDDLPSAMQARYGWTPEKAAAVQAEKAAAAELAEQKRVAAAEAEQDRQRQAAEAAKAQAAREAEAAQKEVDRITAEQRAQEQAKADEEAVKHRRRNTVLAIIAFLYFVPAMIGFRKRNGFAILALNFFLGWTFLGWVIALIWACMRDNQSIIQHTTTHNYTFTQRPAQDEEAEYTDAPLKPVRGRVLPEPDRGRMLPPSDDERRLPPRR